MACKRKREEEIDEEARDWSNLPGNVLYEILQHLDDGETTFNTSRIRSVCSSWHSSLLPLKPPVQFPMKVFFFDKLPNYSSYPSSASLLQSTFFLVSSPVGSESGVWLIKVREPPPKPNVMKLQNPLTMNYSLFEPPSLFKASIDILSCPIKEITRSYVVEFDKDGKHCPAKVVLIWNSKSAKVTFSAMALLKDRDLGLWRLGAEDQISVINGRFTDIITFEGKFYAIDMKGKLIIIDPATFEWNYITPEDLDCEDLDCDDGSHSYLIESNQSLYLVNREYNGNMYPYPEGVYFLRVYLLDTGKEDMKACWDPVSSLEDQVFFVSEYITFSMSAQQLGWSKGNCVVFVWEGFPNFWYKCDRKDDYFSQYYPGEQYFTECLSVFSLEDQSTSWGENVLDQRIKLFWPPPDWLQSVHSKQYPTCFCSLCIGKEE